MRRKPLNHRHSDVKPCGGHGFTLIEAVIVIAITGIIAAVVAVFIRAPVQGYFDAARRAELTDIADTAVRRMSRDLHLALPNSLRVPTGSNQCFEYMPVATGGRYRAEQDCTGACAGDMLDFDAADGSFDVLGALDPVPAANDRVVVYNLGIPGADAYSGDNVATIASATANSINLSANTLFPLASPGSRFHIVPNAEPAVFYVCSNVGTNASGNGTGTLFRLSGYAIDPVQPATCPAIPAGTPILARNVSACEFSYANGVTERNALMSIRLTLTQSSESVSLYHSVHVNNVP